MSDVNNEEVIDTTTTDTQEEFRTLYQEIVSQRARLKGAAKKLGGEAAQVLSEVDGTVLDLMQDFVAQCGGAFEAMEERIYNLEEDAANALPNESFLLEEDAQQYIAYFEQMKRLLSELANAQGCPPEQKQVFDTLLRMTDERMEFTRIVSSTDDGDDDDDDDDTGPQEGEGVGQA